MRRLVLLALVAIAALVPGRATAAAPCRDQIYNDWYSDGKIASTYPLACYRDALKHVPRDAAIYSSLKDDIRSALQAAIERGQGKRVPTSVGHGLPKPDSSQVKDASVVLHTTKSATSKAARTPKTTSPASTDSSPPTPRQHTRTLAAPVASTGGSGGGGIPMPILVLGGLALALAATGAIGAGVRYFRR